jgi:hypothetical protein
MNEADMKAMKRRLTRLAASPLFRLSLASNELFHSNFIHWLLQHPNEELSAKAQALFCEMIGAPERRVVDPQREKNHNDLVLVLEDCNGKESRQVIIENKVKSWRSMEQLGAYSESARKKGKLPLLFVLLSLTVPPEAEDGQEIRDGRNEGWIFLSYDRLNRSFIKPLRKAAVKEGDSYLSALLEDYSSMIADMTQILERDLFPDGKGERILGDLTPLRIEELSNVLKEPCKLNAIFEKGLFERFEGMAAGIVDRLPAKRKGQWSRGRKDKDIATGSFTISSGYSSSGQHGYLNLAYRCKGGLVIGVQIEGGQYRHFISHVRKGISVERFVDSYFDPGRVGARAVPGRWVAHSGKELDPPAGNSRYVEYCSFENKHFLYLHTPIGDMPMSEILEVAVADVLRQAGRAASLEPRRTRLTKRP